MDGLGDVEAGPDATSFFVRTRVLDDSVRSCDGDEGS